MKNSPSRRSVNGSPPWIQVTRTWATACVPLAGTLALGFLAASLSGRSELPGSGLLERGLSIAPGVLHAADMVPMDSDLDGLPDSQERVIGASPFFADTDGDGFSDAEELARNSRVDDSKLYPLPATLDLGMTARGQGGDVRLVTAIYIASGDLSGYGVELGVMLAGRLIPLDPEEYLRDATLIQVPSASGAGTVALLDVPIDPALVHLRGQLSVFATLTSGTQSVVLGAASVDLLSRDGVIVIVQDPGDVRPTAMLPNGGTGYGSVYNPIPPGGGGDIPVSWVPGEICYQASIVVAVSNGVVTREVVAADCIDGWDANCRADCSSSIGETFDTFDPLGLVGY